MNEKDNNVSYRELLVMNLDKLHTTSLGYDRIKRNINLGVSDIILWCKEQIKDTNSFIIRRGKNYYINNCNYEITVNCNSYTIITVHKKKKNS